MKLGIILPRLFGVSLRGYSYERKLDLQKHLEGVNPTKIFSHHHMVENYANRMGVSYVNVSLIFPETVDLRYSYTGLPEDRSREISKYIVNNCESLIIFFYDMSLLNISISKLAFEKGVVTKFVNLDKPIKLPMPSSYEEIIIKKIRHGIEEYRDKEYERITQSKLIYQYGELQQTNYSKMVLSVYGTNINVEIFGTDFFWIESKIKTYIPNDFEQNEHLDFFLDFDNYRLISSRGYTGGNRTTIKKEFEKFKQNNSKFINSSSFGHAPLKCYLKKQ